MVKSNLFQVWKRHEMTLGREITYREVSADTGLSTATLRRWLADKVERFDKNSLDKLCAYFECDVADLIVRVPS